VRRLLWTAIGAAGGILAYRKGQQLLLQAQEQGMLVTAQQAGASVGTAAAALVAAATRPQEGSTVNPSPQTVKSSTSASLPILVGTAAAAAFRKVNS
jgi:hypothetical protein